MQSIGRHGAGKAVPGMVPLQDRGGYGKAMRIFLTGASGFIGGHLLRGLVARGHEVTCLVRAAAREKLDAQHLAGVTTVVGEFTRPQDWLAHLPGHQAVINSVGIIRPSKRATFTAVHRDAPLALFRAAQAAGAKVIQISALGADARAASQYHVSKRAADEGLAALGIPYVILRPSFVYGPGDHSMTFFRSLAALPMTPVPGDGQYRVQPVHVDDVVEAVVKSVERPELTGLTLDLGGASAISFDHLLDSLAKQLGKSSARKWHVPWGVMERVAQVTDGLGQGPITGEELAMLRQGSQGDNGPFERAMGFAPMSFETGLARNPLTEADRDHARLVHFKVPLRLSVAFIWIATGVVSAFLSPAEGFALLERIGMTGGLASAALYGTSLFEIAIGLATAVGWRVRWMGAIQLLLMFGFMGILTALLPEFWIHPFGPLTKNIPLIGATLVMMAWEE